MKTRIYAALVVKGLILNPFKPAFTIVIFIHYKLRMAIFIHYKPRIAVAILNL